jgi:hypothetical protein
MHCVKHKIARKHDTKHLGVRRLDIVDLGCAAEHDGLDADICEVRTTGRQEQAAVGRNRKIRDRSKVTHLPHRLLNVF